MRTQNPTATDVDNREDTSGKLIGAFPTGVSIVAALYCLSLLAVLSIGVVGCDKKDPAKTPVESR